VTRSRVLGCLSALLFVAVILAANYVTTGYGMVPVGFGLMATAGTYFAGLAFLLRDAIQETLGRNAVLVLIVTGAALSYVISDPFIATASAVAFLVSEAADFAVYTPLRERSLLAAVTLSNTVGAIVDTLLFLTIAGFPLAQAFTGQVVGKVLVTAPVLVLLLVLWVRQRRQVVTA
jgi:queuosine precursor transporter